ncbi:DUF371 domain-containing protein [Goodfellowiella coeruleoviolacea]|uniref:DUF371 domain-containing protein n=1 Tax=Goodfellowiella coeruleoviolacea TaxID=334858 RepID=A0AAE3GAH4_9PSEU|nr:DUF371 domain-containing protein [Goodfellowiella coeruleoviolacea]MCP2164208.1 hypothetical protein [Goodfellowiella coeruleoviolacea]
MTEAAHPLARRVEFTAVGHPDITARHDKTLEFTADPVITARATCVIGTGARLEHAALRSLRGRVRMSITCDGLSAVLTGQVNPHYATPDRLVVRRSAVPSPDTYLVNADTVASGLDRDLVARMREPGAVVEVGVVEQAPTPVLVVLLAEAARVPPPPAVAELLDEATLVLHTAPRPGFPWPPLAGRPRQRLRQPDDVAVLGEHRTAVLLLDSLAELAGRKVREILAAALPSVRVVLWPAPLPAADLVLAAGLVGDDQLAGGVTAVTTTAGGSWRRSLAEAGRPVVVHAGPDDAEDVLAALGSAEAPARTAITADGVPGPGVRAVRWPVERLEPAVLGAALAAHPWLVVVADAPSASVTLPAAALAERLTAAGASTKDVARTLVELGLDRRSAYDVALRSRS